jgi:hypothetical protein
VVPERWSKDRRTEAPKYLDRAERNQYQAGRKSFMESREDQQAQGAQDQRPRCKGQGKDSTTKTAIVFTVAQ